MLCPFMITFFFGMKIWGLNILTQEGTLKGLVEHLLPFPYDTLKKSASEIEVFMYLVLNALEY